MEDTAGGEEPVSESIVASPMCRRPRFRIQTLTEPERRLGQESPEQYRKSPRMAVGPEQMGQRVGISKGASAIDGHYAGATFARLGSRLCPCLCSRPLLRRPR